MLYSYFLELHKFWEEIFIHFLHQHNEIERKMKILDLIYDKTFDELILRHQHDKQKDI